MADIEKNKRERKEPADSMAEIEKKSVVYILERVGVLLGGGNADRDWMW